MLAATIDALMLWLTGKNPYFFPLAICILELWQVLCHEVTVMLITCD